MDIVSIFGVGSPARTAISRQKFKFKMQGHPRPRVLSRVLRIPGYALTFLLLSGALSAQSALDRIVAVVDDDVIMASELAGSVTEVEREMRSNSASVPDRQTLVTETLNNLINERVLLHEAERRGVQIAENEIDAAVRKVAERNRIDEAKLEELLEADGQTLAGYRASIKSRLMVRKLVDGEINRQVTVSDDELEMAMQQQAREGGDKEGVEYRMSRILISAPKGADELELRMVRGRAENLLEQIKAGENFGDVAAQYSDGPEAGDDGSLGWRSSSELPALYLQELSSMQSGEVSQVLSGPNGFHILKLDDTRGGKNMVIQEYRIRQILIRNDNILSLEESLNRAVLIRERIVQGEDFAELARANSDDASSQSAGGDMGWVSTAVLPGSFAKAVTELKPGELSEPVQTQLGFHLIELMETRQQDATELVELDTARRKLMQRKSEELYSLWAGELRARAYVELRLDQL